MNSKQFKQLIKEAVREALREELGSSKLNESQEAWPSVSFTSKDVSQGLRQSLAEKMGLPPLNPNPPVNTGGIGGGYADILAQTAMELRNNPAEINNFKTMGG